MPRMRHDPEIEWLNQYEVTNTLCCTEDLHIINPDKTPSGDEIPLLTRKLFVIDSLR